MDTLSTVRCALEDVELMEQKGTDSGQYNAELQLLASGGYNDVWLVARPILGAHRYVLRKPKEGSLLPDQLRNEVSWLTFVKQNLKNLPVPRVYAHSLADSEAKTHYLAEEFMEGQCLSAVWKTYDEDTKVAVAQQIATIIVELGETTFDYIGGLNLDHAAGPTVEGMKLFKGRVRALPTSIGA